MVRRDLTAKAHKQTHLWGVETLYIFIGMMVAEGSVFAKHVNLYT